MRGEYIFIKPLIHTAFTNDGADTEAPHIVADVAPIAETCRCLDGGDPVFPRLILHPCWGTMHLNIAGAGNVYWRFYASVERVLIDQRSTCMNLTVQLDEIANL